MKATKTELKEGCVKCKERREGQYIEAEISTLHYNRDCVCITFNYQDWCWSKKCLSFDNEVTIERGTRIAQMLLVNYKQVQFEEVDSFQRDDRGGFGSTGFDS